MCFPQAAVPSPTGVERRTMAAQLQFAPQVYQANAQYSPLYTQLGLKNLSSFFNGDNTTPGFLDMYTNNILPRLTGSMVENARTSAPGIIAGERAGNPGAAGILDTLTAQAGKELSYGTHLTPEEQVQMNQSVRGGSAARGMGFGPSDVFDESMAETGFGQNLLKERQGGAAGLVPMLQSFYQDPFNKISGMGMTAGGVTGASGGTVAPAMLSEFNPGVNDSTLIDAGLRSNMQSAGATDSLITSGVGAGASIISKY